MQRAFIIAIGGLALAAAAYLGSYYAAAAKARAIEKTQKPELAWLKQEFQLGDAEFQRICQMHKAYLEGCAERCRQVDEKNEHLRRLLAATNQITPEIEQTLQEAAQLRTECQKKMLQHFYDVSQTMPAEQGKRYLKWIQAQTIHADTHAQMSGNSEARNLKTEIEPKAQPMHH